MKFSTLKNVSSLFKAISSCFLNIVSPNDLIYFVEAKKWSIFWDGFYITQNLSSEIKSAMRMTTKGLIDGRAQIIHFGSINTFNPPIKFKKTKTVVTYFHVTPNDWKNINKIIQYSNQIDILHTSSTITKKTLAQYGFKKKKDNSNSPWS